ncbi:hypothetical protein K488DRAFT_14222, partial [Vararia minispora EC-137]
PAHKQSVLARWIGNSPARQRAFRTITALLGANTRRQLAVRREYFLYYKLCSQRAEEEYDFWKEECHLPPTFQSWFTITNLHVWLLMTRLRALPAGFGEHHVQALLNHFFADVEARIRDFLDADEAIPLSPVLTARRQTATFYPLRRTAPGAKRKPAPEIFISRQMKIFREQYNGLTLALDLGLAHGSDAELAAAVWRNLLGARGRDGIAYSGSPAEMAARDYRDDGSGVRDFVDGELAAYVRYPGTMLALVGYMRQEIARLAVVPDK